MNLTVRKRDGLTVQEFDLSKITAAIRGAWLETEPDDPAAIAAVAKYVESMTATMPGPVGVESVQDLVELALMRSYHFAVAKSFIVFRENRAQERRDQRTIDPDAISDYIHASKYARHREDLGRRELFSETVARVEQMHLDKFPKLASDITGAFDTVREKRVLPSMRSLQFGGDAVLKSNCRGFNCSATLIDRPRAFAEALYLLLCGCGVGYSVQFRHVDKLPPIARQTAQVQHHVVGDTIEGWADALDALIMGAFSGQYVEFAYHDIRDKGSPLKTSGGSAPGHIPLRRALERIREVLLGAQGRQLRPIECHRILCHAADAVRSGGIRRSAMIALFSLDDGEMMHCKADASWFEREPWLARANNSAVLKRGAVNEEQFRRVFKMTRNFGEPGFIFVSDWDHAYNPCAEAGLDPVLEVDGVRLTGWSFCNLTEINAAMLRSKEDFMRAARAATLIGTLQAAYTTMPYLGAVTEQIVRRDALLGIGMTGMQDSPKIALDPEIQLEVANSVRVWNAHYAARIGINSAARTTLVKPSGTTSLVLACKDTPAVASGIHPHHSRRYIRRVSADEGEPTFEYLRKHNALMCVRKPDGGWVVEFPIEVGVEAVLRDDLSAVEFLRQVRLTQQNWIAGGTARDSGRPGLTHSVSNTVTVREDEWDAVADYVWAGRDDFATVSFLPHAGDTIYQFAPFEAVQTPEQERRWRALVADYVSVDYSMMSEVADTTDLSGEAACAGGACVL